MNTIIGVSSAGITFGWAAVIILGVIFGGFLVWHYFTFTSLRRYRRGTFSGPRDEGYR